MICRVCNAVASDAYPGEATVVGRGIRNRATSIDSQASELDLIASDDVELDTTTMAYDEPTENLPLPPRAQTVPAPIDLGFTGSDDATSVNDPFAPQHTAKVHLNRLFRSATDAAVLGDVSDIAESVMVEQPDARGNDDFLVAHTNAEQRVFVPVLVHIGRDIANNLRPEIVLRVVSEAAMRAPLSPFERFVLREIDGQRPVARIQARMNVSTDDLRLALALLLDKGVIEGAGLVRKAQLDGDFDGDFDGDEETTTIVASTPSVDEDNDDDALEDDTLKTKAPADPRSPQSLLQSMLTGRPAQAVPPPTPPTLPPSAWDVPAAPIPSMPRPASSRQGRGLVIDSARSQAADLYEQCLRDIKNGELARAWQLACMALQASPNEPRYQALIDDWQQVVEENKTREDTRLYAQAVRAESLGDINRAVTLLKSAVAHNPDNAAAWNRLGLNLARNAADLQGAVAALEKATALVPDDAVFRSNLGKAVAAAERRGLAGLLRLIRR